MQIRPVNSFSALAVTPRTMRMCSCGTCSSCSPTVTPKGASKGSDTSKDDKGVQQNADGDTYSPSSNRKLSDEDQAKVRELKTRDTEVRAHENAHKAAAGGLARGGPNYEYKTGPDGKRYAVGGDVQIDMSPGRTPEETLAKAQRIRAAGLAPAEPSGQDRAVVAQAAQMESAARAEKAEASSGGTKPGSAESGRSSPTATNDRPRLDLVA